METVIQNVLSGGFKPQPKKDTSAENENKDFQELLAAAKDQIPSDNKEVSEPESPQKPNKESPQESLNPDTKEPNGAESLILFFGMPQILPVQGTSIPEQPSTNVAVVEPSANVTVAEPATVMDATGVPETEIAQQQDSKQTLVMPDKTREHGGGTQNQDTLDIHTEDGIQGKTVETAAGSQKMSEKASDGAAQLSEKPARSVGEKNESGQQTASSDTMTAASYIQRDLGIQQPKTSEALLQVHVNEAQPQEMTKDISDVIAKSIQNGKQEFEIQLEPLHLGKLAIKVTYEAGKAAVSILCSSTKTLEAMAQNAKEIGAILDHRLGTDTQIVVEHPEQDYLHQKNQQNEQGQSSQNQQGQNQREQAAYGKDTVNQTDFLQQLRLGLV